MSLERLIVQNIKRNELKESIGVSDAESNSSEVRKISDLFETLSVFIEKGYNEYPEETAEKTAYRSLERKLAEFGISINTSKMTHSDKMPGSFEKDSDRFKVK